jgi:hypothetical protein
VQSGRCEGPSELLAWILAVSRIIDLMKLLIYGVVVLFAVAVLSLFMQYVPAARKLGDLSGPRMTNSFHCPAGKNFHIVIAFGPEIAPSGQVPPFKAWATLQNESKARMLVDSNNSQCWATVEHAPNKGGFIFNWPPSEGNSFYGLLQPHHSYKIELEFEQLPTVPASIWLVWKKRALPF